MQTIYFLWGYSPYMPLASIVYTGFNSKKTKDDKKLNQIKPRLKKVFVCLPFERKNIETSLRLGPQRRWRGVAQNLNFKYKSWFAKINLFRHFTDFHKWVSLNILDWQDNIVLTAVPRSQISQQIQIWQRSTVTELSSLLASWASCFGWVIVGATADTRPRLKKAARSLRAGNAGRGGCCRGVIKSNHLRQHFYRSKCLSIYPSIKNTFILNQNKSNCI